MKIGRIKEITDVGTFANFKKGGGKLGFEDITFIYGKNTFGKSTLVDIFQSYKKNTSNIINERKTIPKKGKQQKVVFTIKTQKDAQEEDIKFENNCWNCKTWADNLEIFGSEFIHDNLFTGLAMERGNKEKFTQFILGEQGVGLAERIKLSIVIEYSPGLAIEKSPT